MDQFLAIAGKVGPPGLLVVVCLMILTNKLVTEAHVKRLTDQLDAQIIAMTLAHKEAIETLTTAHNLRVEQMTEAHDKNRQDHQNQLADVRASYTAQIQNLTEVYGKQVSWTADDRNGWHEAYDDLAKELPVIAGSLNKLTDAHENLSDQLIGREITARQRVEDDVSH